MTPTRRVRTSRPLRSTARSPIDGTVTFACAPDSIRTLELRTELRDRTASPRMRHRTPNDQAHLAPVPDPVLPYRSTARRSAQAVKLRQTDDTVMRRTAHPSRSSKRRVRGSSSGSTEVAGYDAVTGVLQRHRTACSGREHWVRGRGATRGRCMSPDGTRAHWQGRWQGGTGSSRVTDH